MRKVQQQRSQATQFQPRNLPLINLSSSDQSDSDNEKQNRCNESIHTAAHTIKPVCKSPTYNQQHQNNVNTLKGGNLMQFSTLSLDEGSVMDMDQQIRSLMSDNKQLQRTNEALRGENTRLRTQLSHMSNKSRQNDMERQYKERLDQCYAQIEQSKLKYKKLQEQLRKTEKKYQNRLINQELPSKKTISEQNSRIYRELTQKIKQICSKFIQHLSKEKMNANVEGIISDHVKQLLQLNPTPPSSNTTNTFSEYNSNKSTFSITPNRYPKLAQQIKQENDSQLNISSDYRLLQKSIQKLKAMEKQIDSRTPSYLRRPIQKDESILSRSMGLDQSTCSALDKSKSKRKRIFQ